MGLITTKVDVEQFYDADTQTVQRDTITTYLLLGVPVWRNVVREKIGRAHV